MGTQTIASPSGSRQQHSPMQGLTRQGSIYNLTLDEVQCHLGEPLHSMNLDDLLKNVFAADGNTYLSMDIESSATQLHMSSSESGLSHQGSITMNQALSKKTVDEVWKDIQQKKKSTNRESRKPTLGEMTLEDFLVKAGVVTKLESEGGADHMRNMGFSQGPHWLHSYQQMSAINHHYVPGRLVPQPMCVGASSILEVVFPEGEQMVSAISSDPQTPGRKRRATQEDVGEKTVERRKKRMIKNRESAARSRARKQAYTNELENKVSRLEEENEMLRKQKELHELDTVLHSAPPPESKYQLRRLGSAPF